MCGEQFSEYKERTKECWWLVWLDHKWFVRDDREELTLEDADVGMRLNVVLRFCKVIRATRYGGLIQIKSILTYGLTREREGERRWGSRGAYR